MHFEEFTLGHVDIWTSDSWTLGHSVQCHSWEAFFGKIISFYWLLAVISGFWWSY